MVKKLGGRLMDTYKNLKKRTKAGLFVSFALIIIGFVFSAMNSIMQIKDAPLGARLIIWSTSLMYLIVALYVFFGYKKPHGNMLKYTFIAFSFLTVVKFFVFKPASSGFTYSMEIACCVVAAMMITYMSGRLDKIKKNMVLMLIIGLLIVAGELVRVLMGSMFSVIFFLNALSKPICWLALCFAYVARYEQHKAAGLEDE